ncbi:MAG TPA: hypothetical protein VM925_20315 [Labilithrix sp.]|nr:hypothetical protein [Labilithrix sp.]
MSRSIVVIVVGTVIVTACSGGSGDEGEGATSACATAGTRICERACSCGSGTSCKTGFQGRYGTTTFTWSDLSDCKGNYAVSRCRNGGPAGVDFAACESAVAAASCTGDVFAVPQSCEPPRDGG